MKHLNLILALLCLLTWVSLYLVYYKEKLIPWAINRFTRDKMPKSIDIKDGYFSDGIAVPFRENLHPSKKPSQAEEGENTEPSPQQMQKHGAESDAPPPPHQP
ncbi:hypothetical protein GM556_02740 [Bombella sp. ESL0378]|uniref:hypothetical protein n=1 Tax=Bombella sp. ESL0378 TaxID=2676442 RepID=UPI0012D9A698|nr:hypothetical protein [Bombella sp. ESL0378]MUG04468.1 hypothetical protein [Bombella sp. ESL0378]